MSKEPPLFIFETIYVTYLVMTNVLWFGHAHFRCFTFYINQFIIHSRTHTHTHAKNKLINENENKNLTAIYTAELFPRILTCRFRFFNFRRKDLDVTNFQLQHFIRNYI